MTRLSLALVAGVLLVLIATSPRADDKPADKEEAKAGPAPAGTWKFMMPTVENGGERPLWLLKFEKKDSGWSGAVLAAGPRWPEAKMPKVSVTGEELRFTLELPRQKLPCVFKLAKESKGEKLYGTCKLKQDSSEPVELEKTNLTTLEPFDQLKEMLAKQPLGVASVAIAMKLLENAEASKAKPADVRSWTEKAFKAAALYGADYQRDVIADAAGRLLEQKGFEAIALQYARRAERLLDQKESPRVQKRVLETLATALEKAGREADAKEVNARILKLDFRLKPKPFAGRKGKSDRVVLVELFTGAQCPPCVAADLAFDALAKTFKPSEVVLLQYHLHIPRPDPLTSPASDARQTAYEELVQGTPTVIINGGRGPRGGGAANDATEKYEEYVESITPLLEKPSKAELKLSASRKENKVSISAEVAKLAETGDDVKLRVALVEETVAYKGANGLPVHHQVVRAFAGGESGTVMKEKSMKKTFTIDLDDLRKKLNASLDKVAEERKAPLKERPMEMKKLRVVAFVQNDKTTEVLQAVQSEVKSE
jgi:hypothetical protein